jgi:hypothetical protein
MKLGSLSSSKFLNLLCLIVGHMTPIPERVVPHTRKEGMLHRQAEQNQTGLAGFPHSVYYCEINSFLSNHFFTQLSMLHCT